MIKRWWAAIKKWFGWQPPVSAPPEKPPAPDPPPPEPTDSFVVQSGARIEKKMRVPFTVTYVASGIDRFSGRDTPPDGTNNPDAAMLGWSYVEWSSGKKPPVVLFRTYRLIVNDDGTPRESQKIMEEEWRKDRTYEILMRVGREEVTVSVRCRETGGIPIVRSLAFKAPTWMIAGIGWPHVPRPGVRGMRILEVRWIGEERAG